MITQAHSEPILCSVNTDFEGVYLPAVPDSPSRIRQSVMATAGTAEIASATPSYTTRAADYAPLEIRGFTCIIFCTHNLL